MLENHRKLYEAIGVRRSFRTYNGQPLQDEHIKILREACENLPPLAGKSRVILVNGPAPDVFPGLVIKGFPAFLAVLGYAPSPHCEEEAGYSGEWVVLAAASAGLGTCWITGTYKPQVAARRAMVGQKEKLLAAIPVGYPGQAGTVEKLFKAASRSATRLPTGQLLTPESIVLDAAPAWARQAVEAARFAPSAANRQPWRFTIQADRILVSTNDYPNTRPGENPGKRLDCGMAMAHLEIGALAAGIRGRWEWLDSPHLAVYIADNGSGSTE